MVEWDPVAGLTEIARDDLRVGDEVVQILDNGRTFTHWTIRSGWTYREDATYYLIERKVEEPSGRGDLVEIYRPNPEGGETEEVETYVRARHKFQDESFGGDEAWTDSANDLTKSWVEIVGRAAVVPEFSIRTYTATHKENK